MALVTRDLVERAIAGDVSAGAELYRVVCRVSQVRITRVLLCRGAARYRDQEEEVLDLVHELMLDLLENDGHRLKSWDPERGASFENFIGLMARQKAAATFRKQGDGLWRDVSTAP